MELGTSEDQFLFNLDGLIRFLKWRMKKLVAKTTKLDEFQHNCCGYLLTQIDRLKKYNAAPIEELASICRNIFELIVTVKYYGTNEADPEVFLLQAEDDEIIIDEGLAELA